MALLNKAKDKSPPPMGVKRYSVLGDDVRAFPTVMYQDSAGPWVLWEEVKLLLEEIKKLKGEP